MTRKLPPDAPAKIRAMYDSGHGVAHIHRAYPQVSVQRIGQIAKRTPHSKTKRVTGALCETSAAIVAYVTANNPCSLADIARALDIYNARTGRLVEKLIKADQLAHVPYSNKVTLP